MYRYRDSEGEEARGAMCHKTARNKLKIQLHNGTRLVTEELGYCY